MPGPNLMLWKAKSFLKMIEHHWRKTNLDITQRQNSWKCSNIYRNLFMVITELPFMKLSWKHCIGNHLMLSAHTSQTCYHTNLVHLLTFKEKDLCIIINKISINKSMIRSYLHVKDHCRRWRAGFRAIIYKPSNRLSVEGLGR